MLVPNSKEVNEILLLKGNHHMIVAHIIASQEYAVLGLIVEGVCRRKISSVNFM
jgi:hypothetical protein